jgi:hypothetical protein
VSDELSFDTRQRIADLRAEIQSWRDNVRLLIEAHEKTLHELHAARARIRELEEFEAQIKLARRIMADREDALAALAKGDAGD